MATEFRTEADSAGYYFSVVVYGGEEVVGLTYCNADGYAEEDEFKIPMRFLSSLVPHLQKIKKKCSDTKSNRAEDS